MFNLSVDMLSFSGFDGFLKEVNPAFTKVLSWPRDQLLSKPWIRLVHSDDRPGTIAAVQRLISGKTIYAFENRWQCKDGTYRWISWNAFPLPEEPMIFAVGRDVTERKDAEQALRDARDQLESRVLQRTHELNARNESLRAEIARREQTEKHLLRASRAWRALSECNQALALTTEEAPLLNEICRIIVEVAGYPRAWVEFAVKDEAKTVRIGAHKGFEEGFFDTAHVSWADNATAHLTGTTIRTGQTQIARSIPTDASVTPMPPQLLALGHSSAISLPLVADGRVIGALTIPANEPDAFDEDEVKFVTELAGGLSCGLTAMRRGREQERARLLLRQSEERFRKVFQQGPFGIAILGLDYRWVAVNATLCEILGYTEDELTRLSFVDLTHPEDIRKGARCARRLVRGEIPYYRVERRYLRKGGKSVWISLTVAVVRDEEGIPIHFVAMMEDVSKRKRAETRIAEAHEFNRKILGSSPVGIATYRADGQTVTVNDAMCSILGGSQEDLLKKNFHEFTSWRELGMFDDAEEVLSHGIGKRREVHFVTIYGKEVWLVCRLSRFRFGRRPHLLLIAADSSALKRIEQKLRLSEEKFRELAELLPQFVYEINEKGYFTFVNESALQVTEYTREDLERGLHVRDVFIAEDTERVATDLRRTLSGETPGGHEYRVLGRNGRTFDVVTHSAPIVHEGKIVGIRGFAVDITERKKAAEELKASEERFRVLTESSPIGITIFQRGRRQYVNPAFVRTFGYDSQQEILRSQIGDLYAPESQGTMQTLLTDLLEGVPVPYHLEATGLRKNREPFDVSIWMTRTQFQGDPAILSFVVDISDEKSLRSQLAHAQKMEAIGTLAGGMAHDFNNLLTIVQGFSELLLADKDEQDPSYADLQKIHQAAINGADLVRRILAFSRKAEINLRPLDLNSQIEQVRTLLSRTIPKMIKINLVLSKDLHTINADPIQMEQILMNLAVNAKDAMPDGGKLLIETKNVTLDEEYCRLHLGVRACDSVMLSVSDTGQGMDQDTLHHIFEPFYTTKETGKGTGLGLAMVYGIVQQHGGHITCVSTSGKGTTFKIYFPAVPAESLAQKPAMEIEQLGGSETILLVDDEISIRDLGTRMLERSGYQVITAANGKEALSLYKKEADTISLVIMDLIMPEMGGYQCLEELLKIAPLVKVIIASGHYGEGATGETVEMKVRGFIKKPYDMKQVLQMVRETLDKS